MELKPKLLMSRTILIFMITKEYGDTGITSDAQGIRIRFRKISENKYELTHFSVNHQYDADIEIFKSLIEKIIN